MIIPRKDEKRTLLEGIPIRYSLITSVLSLLMWIGATHAANLVSNGNFEKGESGWELNPANMRNGATARIDTSDARSGKGCLILEQSRPIEMPKGWDASQPLVKFLNDNNLGGGATVTQTVPVEAGHAYNLRFWFKSTALLRERKDDPKQGYVAFLVHIDWLGADGKAVPKQGTYWVLNEQTGSEGDWTPIVNHDFGKGPWRSYIAPSGAKSARLRFALVTRQPDLAARVWIDDVVFEDEQTADDDSTEAPAAAEIVPVTNPGFEEADGAAPKGWKPIGSGKTQWVNDSVHAGARSVTLSDAGLSAFSGWSTEITVRPNSEYSAGGWIKTGAVTANGGVAGACFSMQFLDKDGQMLGEQVLSDAVAANSDWKESWTRFAKLPSGTATVRIIAGFEFCSGTAWFDDVSLKVRTGKADAVAHVVRASIAPTPNARYATNLLTNGDVEQGEAEKPKGWTYVGLSERNWTPEQIAALHREPRPAFDVGRGEGSWSHDLVYSGSGALLNVSIDPPLSTNMQFYGRSPVNGYWLSDAMPCTAGKAYLASAWVRPGHQIRAAWFGPLQIRFYDAKGKELTASNAGTRPGINAIPAAEWSYWATLPYVAPEGAVSMRLRFGQELSAAVGGWGRTYADNLAVWELPPDTTAAKTQDFALRTDQFWEWFRAAHAKIKPPYLPAPSDAREYTSCQGWVVNSTPGNLFYDRSAKTTLKVALANQLGESRKVSLQLKRFDWLGNMDEPIEIKNIALDGYGETTAEITLPPSGSYGAFYIEGKILEGEATVGSLTGRYGVLPTLARPRTVENIWSVTTLVPFFGDGRPQEAELGQLLKIAGFGTSWINIHKNDDAKFSKTMREVEWYRSLGIKPILRLNPIQIARPIDPKKFEEYGASIATAFKGKVAAYGNWGVEQSNHRTVEKPVFRPILNGKMLTDEEYDIILTALHDGIKSVDKETPVLIGNIATDSDGGTVRRLYGKPAEGRFDGAVINAYSSVNKCGQVALTEFDRRGGKHKTIWYEEIQEQQSPFVGPARRRAEAEGPRNMVRVWLTLKANFGERLKAVTLWGFGLSHTGGEGDIVMVTPRMQPRPHFVAHAVMADMLADAVFQRDLSNGNMTVYEWKRSDGPLFTVWANSGERSITFEVPDGALTTTDLMGNQINRQATGGVVSLTVTSSPLYVAGGKDLKISSRLGSRLENGSTEAGKPQIRLTLINHSQSATAGTVQFTGPVIDDEASRTFKLAPDQSTTIAVRVKDDLPVDRRTSFLAECTTEDGGIYTATAALNFAVAVKTETPPSLDGTWKDWSAPAIEFGTRSTDVYVGTRRDSPYTGAQDVSGKLRMLWDEQCLYLGVEAIDDSFRPVTERGSDGFAGDSIEFGCQPDGILSPLAPYWEYELYLPSGKAPYAASRRSPKPSEVVTSWKAAVTSPSAQGANYQVAIPWKDMGVSAPAVGKTISFALVLNDADVGKSMQGDRTRVRWFEGLDIRKSPENFGDVTLVIPAN